MDTNVVATTQGFVSVTEQPASPISQSDRALIAQHGLGAWLGSQNAVPTVEYSPMLDELAQEWLFGYLSETLDVGFAEPPVISARCGQVYRVDLIPTLLTINEIQRRSFDPPVPVIVPELSRPRTANYQRSTRAHSIALAALGNALRSNTFELYNNWLKQTNGTAQEVSIGLTGVGEAMAFSTWMSTLRAEIRKLRDKVGITRRA
jgi:hypothetical protein